MVLLSARLSPASIKHLIAETSAQAIVVSTKTIETAREAVSRRPDAEAQILVLQARSYRDFFNSIPPKELDTKRAETSPADHSAEDVPGALILHSSGTTGMPKPIRLAHRYLLGYAACHRLPESVCGKVCLSTLPMFHVSGGEDLKVVNATNHQKGVWTAGTMPESINRPDLLLSTFKENSISVLGI